MASELYVFVYLPGATEAVPAGRLLLDEDARHGLFDYGRRYLQRSDAVPVDPVALPLGPARYECREVNGGLFGAPTSCATANRRQNDSASCPPWIRARTSGS